MYISEDSTAREFVCIFRYFSLLNCRVTYFFE
jgi:hypothetical protein